MKFYLHDDPRLAPEWGPWFAHEYINYFTVCGIGWIQDLPPVRVMPCPGYRDWPVGPEHVDAYKERFRPARHVDSRRAFDYAVRNGDFATDPPLDLTIEPWKILLLYPTEPDLRLDCGLKLGWKQVFTGGSHGLRHMKFRMLGMPIGQAPASFQCHLEAALKAFRDGNDYWGWRFLARATHYLADLGHPFHVNAAPPAEVFSWPFSPRRIFRKLSALHQGYEVYTEIRFRQETALFREPLALGARDGQGLPASLNDLMPDYIRRAEARMVPVSDYLKERFGPELIDVFRRMDDYRHLDASMQTMMCSAEAARVIFRDDGSGLEWLDRMTGDILYDVGRMLGRLAALVKPETGANRVSAGRCFNGAAS